MNKSLIPTEAQVRQQIRRLRLQPGDLLVVTLSRESDVTEAGVRRTLSALKEIGTGEGITVFFMDEHMSLDHMTAAQLRDIGLVSVPSATSHIEIPPEILGTT